MSPRPKYTAAVDFSTAGQRFIAGDRVDNPVVLDAVLRFGDRFVTTNTKRSSAGKLLTEMTRDELVTYVEENKLDVATSQNKPELLAAVQAASLTTPAPADPPKEQ